MAELGSHTADAHREIGRRSVELGVNCLLAVGKFARQTAQAAEAAGLKDVSEFADVAGAAAAAKKIVKPGDLVLLKASRATGLPVLVGHQRRHNPIIRKARALIADGVLGRPVSVTVLCTWFKPREYFDAAWRRQKGGGPILINLIHVIDLMRHLFGEIASVQAMASNAVRGHEVEDTAVAALRFVNGVLGTVTVSDTAVAPWNWDLSAGEAERFPRQDINAHFYSGTEASLTLPRPSMHVTGLARPLQLVSSESPPLRSVHT